MSRMHLNARHFEHACRLRVALEDALFTHGFLAPKFGRGIERAGRHQPDLEGFQGKVGGGTEAG